jgi:hypothetical protein
MFKRFISIINNYKNIKIRLLKKHSIFKLMGSNFMKRITVAAIVKIFCPSGAEMRFSHCFLMKTRRQTNFDLYIIEKTPLDQ